MRVKFLFWIDRSFFFKFLSIRHQVEFKEELPITGKGAQVPDDVSIKMPEMASRIVE